MIVIFDIDNTLCNNDKRYKLAVDETGSINWDVLYDYDNVLEDKPILPTIQLLNWHYEHGHKIVIFTSRPFVTKLATEEWLRNHNILYHSLHMREKKYHYIKDVELKKKMYDDIIDEQVICAYDDKQEIIDLWLSMGIHCFKVCQ